MALLWDASLTDVGVSMISQWAQGAGDKLTITGAVIGEGVVAATQLHTLTQLTDQKSTISIQGSELVANGVKLKLRKTSQGITQSFILNQIGIYAKLDTSGGTPIIADSLIAVYQQDTGVLVPTEADSPDFVFTFYGTVQTNYSGDLTINVDTSALASQDDLDALTLAGLADTDADTPSENNLLFFKGSTDKWTAQANPFSNENLLDNPFFTVNQRGNTSFSSAGYTVDRWAKESSGGGTLTLTSDGIQFPASASGGNFYQIFESGKFLNKKITVTLKYSDGSFAKGTLTYTTPATTVINDDKMKVYLYDDTILLQHNSNDATARTIRAVKLELGTVSTLANDVAPNQAIETAKCSASTADPLDTYANKGGLVHNAEMTSLYVTGSTNNTGSTIHDRTYFYLNGNYCKALANIADGATFTLNTNYKITTASEEVEALNQKTNFLKQKYFALDANTFSVDIPLANSCIALVAAMYPAGANTVKSEIYIVSRQGSMILMDKIGGNGTGTTIVVKDNYESTITIPANNYGATIGFLQLEG